MALSAQYWQCRCWVIFSLQQFEDESQGMYRGCLSDLWNSFLRTRPGSRHSVIRSLSRGMGKRRLSPAGCEIWTERTFRSLRSIVRTWGARSAGFRNPTSLCALVTVVSIMQMGLLQPDLHH